MSRADRSQYTDAVTQYSERELQDVLTVAEPPVCLLGGWAVHIHVTDAFQTQQGRRYIGSRDIDIGVHIDPEWTSEELSETPVAQTLTRIEDDLEYDRGRFGFYQQFHRWYKADATGLTPWRKPTLDETHHTQWQEQLPTHT